MIRIVALTGIPGGLGWLARGGREVTGGGGRKGPGDRLSW